MYSLTTSRALGLQSIGNVHILRMVLECIPIIFKSTVVTFQDTIRSLRVHHRTSTTVAGRPLQSNAYPNICARKCTHYFMAVHTFSLHLSEVKSQNRSHILDNDMLYIIIFYCIKNNCIGLTINRMTKACFERNLREKDNYPECCKTYEQKSNKKVQWRKVNVTID